MIFLDDLFDVQWLDELRDTGFVKIQVHPEFPDALAIANYTNKAQTKQEWNAVTEQTRGLIFNPSTGEVLKRPFRKFYNHDESHADSIDGDTHVTAYDKMDGSLGIVYKRPDGLLAVATRGSFVSDQALWATNWLRTEVWWSKLLGWGEGYQYNPLRTDLFEIIYPENRIVVNYAFSELVYLGSIQTDTGEFEMDNVVWAGRSAEPMYQGPYRELFEVPARNNAEGFVVVTDDGRRVKLKYDEYVRLHRIVTRLSERAVWEMMSGPYGHRIDDLVSRIPEEHGNWARDVAEGLLADYAFVRKYSLDVYGEVIKRAKRKDQAEFLKEYDPKNKLLHAVVFAMLDLRDEEYIEQIIWKQLRPKGDAQ